MLLWQSTTAYEVLPPQVITCPLVGDNLVAYYSLERACEEARASLQQWKVQQSAQRELLVSPSLTKKRRQGNNHMRGLATSSVETRVKSQEQFVGFCVKWMGKQPSLALVMQPQLAAKFIGFLLARGGGHGTIVKHCTQLSETVEFVTSEQWPGEQPWGHQWVQRVKDWYANLRCQSKLAHKEAFSPYASTLTLWQAWQHALSEWEAFIKAFEVGE